MMEMKPREESDDRSGEKSDETEMESRQYANIGYRRTVSLDAKSHTNERKSSQAYETAFNETRATDERNSSLRRHLSEPARSRLSTIKNNIVTRTESFRSMVKKSTAEFFGVDDESDSKDQLWKERRFRLLSNYGGVKTRASSVNRATPMPRLASGFDETDGVIASNNITGFSEMGPTNEPFLKTQLSPNDLRPPVYKLTLKALSKARTAFRKKASIPNETENRVLESRVEPQFRDNSESVTADSVFLSMASEENLDVDDLEFFRKPAQQFEEVDARPPQDIGWFLLRQKSVVATKKIPEMFFRNFMDNSDRRKYGLGLVGKLLDRQIKEDLSKEQLKAIDHIDDHRPYFTYWVTTVQTVILIISLLAYGFGPFGFGNERQTSLVFVPSLSLQQVDFMEPQSFWGGPRAADLIHLGAKFTPCMRKDDYIYKNINVDRINERNTGCCIRNDGSGCVQTFQHSCSPLLSTWYNWNKTSIGPSFEHKSRYSGPVCGQDPRYCEQPTSIVPYEWPDDITKWPICRKRGEVQTSEKHMQCELIARPCCIGIYGQCYITTREYCEFVKGFFHEEATLCSQVSCMEDICGMIPFYSKDTPNQLYRIWTPIFLHAGLGHLLLTILFQYFIMRDIERFAGATRIAIIYLVSGIGGYLASSVFVPFRAEVGPSGSQFGILACLFVEVWNSWNFLEKPYIPLVKLSSVAFVLFTIGLLPWIDNYAHIGGFIIGLLLSIALLPYITIHNFSTRNKIIQIIGCLVTVTVIIVCLISLLYAFPIYDCPFCKYLNCVPFTSKWCDNQNIQVHRVDIL